MYGLSNLKSKINRKSDTHNIPSRITSLINQKINAQKISGNLQKIALL